jgi:hypothetical protein
MVMDDGHGQSMLAALATGPEVDLLGAVSATKQGGGGAYSPYIGVVVDMAKVMESLHTAQYQYIPALALPQNEQLNLKLNSPPSFHKPQSVLVVALPPVKAVPPPVLSPVEPKQVYCMQNPSLALEADGAPLVFATDIAYGFTLHVQNKAGKSLDLPVKPDPSRGGFVVEGSLPKLEELGPDATGTLHGSWGYENFVGPTFHLTNASEAAHWGLSPEDESALVIGREDTFHLHSGLVACVEDIVVKDQHGKPAKISWKMVAPEDIEVKLSLAGAEPGTATLAIKQFASPTPTEVPLHTYVEEVHLDQFTIHAGDQQGLLKGARLDQVASLEINGVRFLPTSLTRVEKLDQLSLSAQNAKTPDFEPEQKLTTKVTLKDGRVLKLQITVGPHRPKLTLVNKRIQAAQSAIRLGSSDDLPLDGRMSFFVKSQIPTTFSHDEKIEVASADGFFHSVLSMADKNLSLQDSQTAVAILDPLKSFGDSAFGSLQFRPVAADGTAGDWQPLAHLVRVPHLKEVRCPEDLEKQCTLVPRPNGTVLYIKLRDDPATINTAVLPVLPDQQ